MRLITNHEWTRMNTNSEKLLLKDEVISGRTECAIEVLNTLRVGVILNFKHREI